MPDEPERDYLAEAYLIADGRRTESGLTLLPQREHLQALVARIGQLEILRKLLPGKK